MSIAWGDSPRIRIPGRLGTAAAVGYTVGQALMQGGLPQGPGNWVKAWWPKPKKSYGPDTYVPSSQPIPVRPSNLRPDYAWWSEAKRRAYGYKVPRVNSRSARHYRKYPKFRRRALSRRRFYREMLRSNVSKWQARNYRKRRRGRRRRGYY